MSEPTPPQAEPDDQAVVPVASEALQVNLSRTAVDVVIPRSQRLLLEVLANYEGLRRDTEALLREVNHPFAGWDQTLRDLNRRALNDFHYLNRHERGAEAIGVLLAIYDDLATERLPPRLRHAGTLGWLRYLDKAARDSGDQLGRNSAALITSLERLAGLLDTDPQVAIEATAPLKRLGASLLPQADRAAELTGRALELQRTALITCYRTWLEAPDPTDWLREIAPDLASLPAEVEVLSHARRTSDLAALRALKTEPDLAARATVLAGMPDQRRIARAYLDAAAATAGPEPDRPEALMRRIRWLARVVGSAGLVPVQTEALREIRRCAVGVLHDADTGEHARLVRVLFELLHPERIAASRSVLNLVRAIGTEVIAGGSREAVDLFVERVLELEFQAPDFRGFTEEWKPVVNPEHLTNVRTYLALIETDPRLASRLIAALVVQLRMHGVFVADTDLFQRDVSQLLAADIAPVYHVVKTLVRLFPVYFNEIGAEGELRDVSTRIDEIDSRRDWLSHFLRKQCHVESNPRMVPLVDEVIRFWATGDASRLRPMLPPPVHRALDAEHPHTRPQHTIFSSLLQAAGDVDTLLEQSEEWLEAQLAALPEASDSQREKAKLMLRLRTLLARKYAIDHDDLLLRLEAFPPVDPRLVQRLRDTITKDDLGAFETLLDIHAALKRVVLDPEPTQSVESIYHKRHIAVGIPSMYGQYREPRFEAMGLILRVESLATVLMERLVDGVDLRYVTNASLRRVHALLGLLARALRLEGFNARGPRMGLAMLGQALESPGFTIDQYLNLFQFLSRTVNYLIRVRFLDVYENDLGRILEADAQRGAALPRGLDPEQAALQASEAFLRELIASSFGPQLLDRLIGRTLQALSDSNEQLGREARDGLLSYDAACTLSPIDGTPLASHEGPFLLGYKGFMIKRLAQLSFPTPPGFILTTESFRVRPAIDRHDELRKDTAASVLQQLRRMEQITESRFGDPTRPLFLSVRSGAPVSMPGMMDTFLNVGVTPAIVESLSNDAERAWGRWDAYRRFLQFWGMSSGMERDLFDRIMRDGKDRAGVAKKALLPAAEMRRVALAYADLVAAHGVEIPEDPFDQLLQSIRLVQDSWHSDTARVYRKAMRIAEEWGTAVIVQQMVFGNLGPESGTGVVFTRPPLRRGSEIKLYGDFILQSQGDDVVSGLVETLPISNDQVAELAEEPSSTMQRDFPLIYGELLRLSRRLIEEHGLQHQEIEFTFEGPNAADLYLLQTRDMAYSSPKQIPTFVPSDELDGAKVGSGIGVGGGALSGRVAYTEADVRELQQEHPDDSVIVLRPDTVPDDISIILQANGLLTTLGGSTSHAAVAAQRLGRTCVVGCRALQVDEEAGVSRIAGHEIRAKDSLSINGIDGSVYLGTHPVTLRPRRGVDV